MEMQTDIGQDIMDKIDEIEARLSGCVVKAENAVKKNAQLHLMINSGVMEKMKKKAESQGISLSEWCRKKLMEEDRLDGIERKLDKVIDKIKREK